MNCTLDTVDLTLDTVVFVFDSSVFGFDSSFDSVVFSFLRFLTSSTKVDKDSTMNDSHCLAYALSSSIWDFWVSLWVFPPEFIQADLLLRTKDDPDTPKL